MSAVKSKVEELCHQFERDQEGTVLSDYPPQVIANTLKLYFRQLPEVRITIGGEHDVFSDVSFNGVYGHVDN